MIDGRLLDGFGVDVAFLVGFLVGFGFGGVDLVGAAVGAWVAGGGGALLAAGVGATVTTTGVPEIVIVTAGAGSATLLGLDHHAVDPANRAAATPPATAHRTAITRRGASTFSVVHASESGSYGLREGSIMRAARTAVRGCRSTR